MTFPPIVAREMTVLASGKRFYWARTILAGFAVLTCLQWLNFNLPSLGTTTVAQESFRMLSWFGFVMALGGAIVTADCISHERREGTLGLLFLTTLKSHDVVLGKLGTMGLVALYALLGFAPVLMLPILNGGLVGGEIARVVLVLVNLVFVSLAAGLFVSVFARSQFGAILGSFTLLGFICVAPFVLNIIGYDLTGFPLDVLSPITTFLIAGDAEYSANPAAYWLSLAVGLIIAWMLIGAAVLALERNWRMVHNPESAPRVPSQSRRLLGAPRVLIASRENRSRAFAPVARAMLRMRGLSEMAWFAAIISLVGSVLNAFVMNRLGSVWAAASISVVFTFASSSLFAFVGGRFLFDARRSGELELLLVTPVGAKGILREQRLALLRVLRAPLYVVVLGSIAVAVGMMRAYDGREMTGLLLGLCQTANAALGVLAVSWTGMWFATRANNAFSIIGWTVGLVEIAPIALTYALPLFLFGVRQVYIYWPLIVPVLLVFKNVFFIRWSRARLRNEFRTKDQMAGDGFFQKLWAAFFGNAPGPHPQVSR